MCGIFFSLSNVGFVAPDDSTYAKLQARGPDSCRVIRITAHSGSSDNTLNGSNVQTCFLTFVASVLALRGAQVQQQPMIDEQTQSVLCWNGEAWKLDGKILHGNDTNHVFQALLAAAKSSRTASHKKILAVVASISGPFAFVFYDACSSSIYYSRDRLGRKSLTRSAYQESVFILSSVSSTLCKATFEVETNGIYRVSLQKATAGMAELLVWEGEVPVMNRDLPSEHTGLSPIPASTIGDVKMELSTSVHMRVADIPTYTSIHTSSQPDRTVAKVAILFSGGLDCTILALLTHDLLSDEGSIDLLNVTFQNPRIVAASGGQDSDPYELCPDRVTGRSSFLELQRLCPQRQWRFVAVNVPFSEVVEHRPLVVQLMKPHNTEMDFSIALALYFAARGRGYVETPLISLPLHTSEQREPYETTARVLISGLGADELFAGYTRHHTAFTRYGYSGLIDELELDFERIGKRNLGRDDRVISHWGREVRYPYLDEDFVRYSLGLQVWQKCGFRYSLFKAVDDDVDPAKKLLRLLALGLGLQGAAKEKKRAIQFGARTAKMEIGRGRRKGTDVVE